MGPSGSGKSTLLHCLAGLDTLTSGATFIGDTYLASLDDKALTELRRTQVGFIFQAFNLIPTLTADENIRLPMMLGGETGDLEWIDHVVTTVGLQDRLDAPTERALGWPAAARRRCPSVGVTPQIIFADEPTGNLDSVTGTEILSFMRNAVRDFGQTIVMVTHDPVAASYADRVVFVGDGKTHRRVARPDHRSGHRSPAERCLT